MQVFLATTPDTAEAVEEKKKLSVTSLGLPPHVRHVPVKDTKEHALDAAIKAKGMELPSMARNWTNWSVIELRVPESTAFEIVSAGYLQRHLAANGWKLLAELDYTGFSAIWETVNMPPMGLDAWTQLVLMPSFKTLPNEKCILCNKRGAAWRSYCGDCWLDYLHENQRD